MSFLTDAWNSLTGYLSGMGSEFDNAANAVRNAASDFSQSYNQFINITPEYRTSNWDATKNYAESARGTVSTFTAAIDYVYSTLGVGTGLSALSALGFAPVLVTVPWLTVAAMGAAVSAILVAKGYMDSEIMSAQTNQAVSEMNIERAKAGLPTINPSDITGNISFGQSVSNSVVWVVVGAGFIILLPKIMETFKHGR
jgi:hypothetical protein